MVPFEVIRQDVENIFLVGGVAIVEIVALSFQDRYAPGPVASGRRKYEVWENAVPLPAL